MAYPAPGHPFQGVRNFWSNPRMILPESGTPLGMAGVSDNAAVLTKNRFIFSAAGDESGQCGSTGGGKRSFPMTRSLLPLSIIRRPGRDPVSKLSLCLSSQPGRGNQSGHINFPKFSTALSLYVVRLGPLKLLQERRSSSPSRVLI